MDTIIYDKDSRKVISILSNTTIEDKDVVLLNNLEITTVNDSTRYLFCDELTGEVLFRNPKSNIIYFQDYVNHKGVNHDYIRKEK